MPASQSASTYGWDSRTRSWAAMAERRRATQARWWTWSRVRRGSESLPSQPRSGRSAEPPMNYYDTSIEVAEDCPATEARVLQTRGGKRAKAVLEYELLATHPYTYTAQDIAF